MNPCTECGTNYCRAKMEGKECPTYYYEPPRPRGEWIENKKYNRRGKRFLNCSICHYGDNGDIVCSVSVVPNFCPNCGADMRKEGEAE